MCGLVRRYFVKRQEQEQKAPPPTRHFKVDTFPTIPGLQLVHDFVSPEERRQLLQFIDRQTWSSALSRRVQQYGYAYNYADLKKTPERTSPIPEAFQPLVRRLVEQKRFSRTPDQIIVNEYLPGQGIAAHVDHIKHFGDVVASLSLGCAYTMLFAYQKQEIEVRLPIGSLVVLSGDARYKWTHSIAKRKTDVVQGARVKRGRRVSVTFRFLLAS